MDVVSDSVRTALSKKVRMADSHLLCFSLSWLAWFLLLAPSIHNLIAGQLMSGRDMILPIHSKADWVHVAFYKRELINEPSAIWPDHQRAELVMDLCFPPKKLSKVAPPFQ